MKLNDNQEVFLQANSNDYLLVAGGGRCELSAAEEGVNTVRQFSGIAYTGGAMPASGLGGLSVIDTATLSVPSSGVVILREHETDRAVGHAERDAIEFTGQGEIRINGGRLSASNQHRVEVEESASNGFPWQMSVGVSLHQANIVTLKKGDKIFVNGRTVNGPVRVVRNGVLREVSFVSVGADPNTSAVVSSQKGVLEMGFESWLNEQGIENIESLSEEVLSALRNQYQASLDSQVDESTEDLVEEDETDDADSDVSANPDSDRIMQAAFAACANHANHRNEIRALAEDAIEMNQTFARFRTALNRLVMANAPGVIIRQPIQYGERVLTAACSMYGNLNSLESQFNERELEEAERIVRGGFGLKQLYYRCALANGYRGDPFSMNIEMQRYAFGDVANLRASAMSTISLPGILSNVANKFLEQGFNYVDATWRTITRISSTNTFHPVSSYSMGVSDITQPVGKGGELQHAKLSETPYTNRVSTRGLILGITREDLVNDNLSALTSVPQDLGRAAGRAVNDVFWRTFMNNAAFFTGFNVSTGAGSALTAADGAGLAKAEEIFMMMTDPDGNPIGYSPSIILVPPALRNAAERLVSSRAFAGGTVPEDNVFAGRFRVAISPYLQNTSFTGNSSTAWYLLSDPGTRAVIDTMFLNGRETPYVETTTADFNVLGAQMRVYHDFGVAMHERRAGVRSAGV